MLGSIRKCFSRLWTQSSYKDKMSNMPWEYKNMDEIEPGLWLGNMVAPSELDVLREHDIRYVLSVFDDKVKATSETITYMKIPVNDIPKEDLLTHFPDAIDFISKALESGHGIVIHCHAGFSRSATVTIAYLMSKYGKSYKEIETMVKSKRSIGPNKGFVDQLKLFEEMGYELKAKNHRFRQHMLKKVLRLGLTFYKWSVRLELYFTLRDMIDSRAPVVDLGPTYRCARCDHPLFNEIHVIKMDDNTKDDQSIINLCDYVYIEPQKWMKELFEEVMAKEDDQPVVPMKCTNCGHELVHYNYKFSPFPCDEDVCAHHCKKYSNKACNPCMILRIDRKELKTDSQLTFVD